ncbi:hypothetical protein H0I54_06970 [Yersinia kristensenii]|uniref:hypothetical protein n=1 Tax=Yersinia kristensenii TaxID=28152 RepID=UPI000B6FCD84|nr:hypothetical protein [Yersinia kristensenii]MBW5816667.1 hypothetical protein [Yersinia kristensenii]MBW5841554.1 hypothetical protein [Yersinia kristensenii]MDA5491537.1 hypothetical protein [Yersinia kristensenii]OWF84828.1 hypothetical protein B4907_06735 [Yersinia kristensenii]
MKNNLLILIVDPNTVFSYGLSLILLNYLSGQGWDVTITYRLSDIGKAHLLFAAGELPYDQLKFLTTSGPGRKSKFIFIINDSGRAIAMHWHKIVDGIIYRYHSAEEITTLITAVLDDNQPLLNI